MQSKIESTTHEEHREIEVPEDVVTAIAARLEAVDDPDAGDVRDLAHDHIDETTEFVTTDGQSLETAVLSRVKRDTERVKFSLDADVVDAIDEQADGSRAEWIRQAARERLEDTGGDVVLEYDD